MASGQPGAMVIQSISWVPNLAAGGLTSVKASVFAMTLFYGLPTGSHQYAVAVRTDPSNDLWMRVNTTRHHDDLEFDPATGERRLYFQTEPGSGCGVAVDLATKAQENAFVENRFYYVQLARLD